MYGRAVRRANCHYHLHLSKAFLSQIEANNPFFKRIHESFSRQGLMQLMGAKLHSADRGHCNIELPYSEKITQQQRNFHGGAIGAIADNAAGYAALSVAPENMEVVTVEYKINFLASLSGGKLIAKGRVLKSGKRLIVTSCDVVHIGENDKQTLCAVLQQTLVPVEKKY